MNTFITKEMLKEAYFRGIVKLVASDNCGTSFQILDAPNDMTHRWQIESEAAKMYSPATYKLRKEPFEIVEEIYETIDKMTSFRDIHYCVDALRCKLQVYSLHDDNVLKLWEKLEDIPFDEDDDGELHLAEDYYIWKTGTSRNDIWGWFDHNFSKGIIWLLYPDTRLAA